MEMVLQRFIEFSLCVLLLAIAYVVYHKYAGMHIRLVDLDNNTCHIIITNKVLTHHEYLGRAPKLFEFNGIDYYWHPRDVDNDVYLLTTAGKHGNSKEIFSVNFTKQIKLKHEKIATV